MVNVGVIGCGRISERRHVPEYSANPDARIIGYFDANGKRAEVLAAQYGGKVYASVDELLADPSIDAVSVCVANNAHAEVTIKALNAGKHVLCEKPMAMTVADCEAMVEAAKKNNRFLMIGQNQRYNTGHARAKELIEQGIIGKPLTFRTSFCHGGPERWAMGYDVSEKEAKNVWFFDKKLAAMGAMADLGIHKADLIQFLLNEKITEVTAKIMTLDKRGSDGKLIGVEDNAICIFKMESGAVGTMTVSWTDYGDEENSTVIFGTKGQMRLYDIDGHTIRISTDRGDKIYYDIDQMMTNANQQESGVIRRFVHGIETSDWSEAAGEMNVNAIRAVLAGFESDREDKTIKLSEYKDCGCL